ncbi:NAD(P)/FAD-dependent oxidoreductase, partial [[Eubacterium] cellulosolvens]
MNRWKSADVVIIGGGIIGCAIAYELARYRLVIHLLEQEPDLSFGATGANTGLVHAGFNPKPGTLKARFNLEGNRIYPELAHELQVPFRRIGALVLGRTKSDLAKLNKLVTTGAKNGIPGLKILTRRELFKIEPKLHEKITSALYAPTAGIVSPYEMTIALAENAAKNGLKIHLSTYVRDIIVKESSVLTIVTNKGKFNTTCVINAAGVFSDEIAGLVGLKDFKIIPRRGEYFVLDKRAGGLVNHTLFPVPGRISKGIVVTPTVDGNLLLGPTAEDIEEKCATETTSTGLTEVMEGARKLIPE